MDWTTQLFELVEIDMKLWLKAELHCNASELISGWLLGRAQAISGAKYYIPDHISSCWQFDSALFYVILPYTYLFINMILPLVIFNFFRVHTAWDDFTEIVLCVFYCRSTSWSSLFILYGQYRCHFTQASYANVENVGI